MRTGATRRAGCALPRRVRLCLILPRRSASFFLHHGLTASTPASLIGPIPTSHSHVLWRSEVTVEPVGDGEDKRMARSMRARCAAPGVSYWITLSRHGRLGGLVFRAASWCCRLHKTAGFRRFAALFRIVFLSCCYVLLSRFQCLSVCHSIRLKDAGNTPPATKTRSKPAHVHRYLQNHRLALLNTTPDPVHPYNELRLPVAHNSR